MWFAACVFGCMRCTESAGLTRGGAPGVRVVDEMSPLCAMLSVWIQCWGYSVEYRQALSWSQGVGKGTGGSLDPMRFNGSSASEARISMSRTNWIGWASTRGLRLSAGTVISNSLGGLRGLICARSGSFAQDYSRWARRSFSRLWLHAWSWHLLTMAFASGESSSRRWPCWLDGLWGSHSASWSSDLVVRWKTARRNSQCGPSPYAGDRESHRPDSGAQEVAEAGSQASIIDANGWESLRGERMPLTPRERGLDWPS